MVVVMLAFGVTCAVLFRPRTFAFDPALDDRTTVAPSRIPGAGNGLFAARRLQPGEVIAEMGSRLVYESRFKPADRGYLFKPPACARADVWPYDTLDGRELGGPASKVNFAPRLINGVETHFQNAVGRETCKRPYVEYHATRVIEPGDEILASYGPDYDYDFMAFPAVRDHFCQELDIDCTEHFVWEP